MPNVTKIQMPKVAKILMPNVAKIQMPNDLNPPPSITLLWVGDIREPQQTQLKFYKEHKFLYITTLYVALMK